MIFVLINYSLSLSLSLWKKRTDIIDLSYNIEECLAVNDYFTD